ncbi:MAG: DUF4188 domain-containing protein [Gammaproteobacteria bacterium]|nr:DUF4188 domain-containing protein [Gammaproteobacteria bacterium]MDH5801397.1 DUF4188 domain-containing protein [Gammaproteobacteria bacterium]
MSIKKYNDDAINKQRMVPDIAPGFVVFIFGIRINKIWMLHKWIPVVRSFKRMLSELQEHPEWGLLHFDYWSGNPRVSVQYWRSYDDLLGYARDKGARHFPAWFNFNNEISGSGAVGLWHETFVVQEGSFEAVYKNVPALGMGKAGGLKLRDGPKISLRSGKTEL